MTFTKKLVVPAVWVTLLAIKDFVELPFRPQKWRWDVAEAHNVDPTPFRCDEREVVVIEGDYTVVLGLFSGDNNYWLSYNVFKKETSAENFDDAESVYEFGEAFYDLPSRDKLELSDGEEVTFEIEQQ